MVNNNMNTKKSNEGKNMKRNEHVKYRVMK